MYRGIHYKNYSASEYMKLKMYVVIQSNKNLKNDNDNKYLRI